jgi:predicted acetyltransferase
MPITIRQYQDADRDAAWDAIVHIYGDGLPAAPERELPKGRVHVVAMDGSRCVGIYAMLEFDSICRGEKLATGGIAMVGVVPDQRHTGLGKQLMRFSLKDMRERGKKLASLYGFAETYYRQFGYETCGVKLKIECPIRLMPKFESNLPIRRLEASEFHQIEPCYGAFAAARSGMVVRDVVLWDRLFGRSARASAPPAEKTVYAAGNPVEAYVVVKHAVDFHVPQEIAEVAWSSQAGYEAALTLMRSLGINKSGVTWLEPPDSPFVYRYMASTAQTPVTFTKPTMFRIVDVPGTLQALTGSASCKFTLRVIDPDLPENEGPWLVTAGPNGVAVEPTTSADVEMDIRAFTQACLGDPSFESLLANGQVKSTDHAAREVMKLLPPKSVYCLDFF